MEIFLFIFVTIGSIFCGSATHTSGLLTFPGTQVAEYYIRSLQEKNIKDRFARTNPLATKFQIWSKEALVLFPCFEPGAPITSARTLLRNGGSKLLWRALPYWDNPQDRLCDGVRNATDISITSNNLAWILDSGDFSSAQNHCPAKVVVVELGKNRLHRLIDFGHFTPSRLDHLAVGQSNAGHTFLYVSDSANNAIIVWDVMKARGWKVILPDVVQLETSPDDVLYLALLRNPDGSNLLLLSYLSSPFVFTVRTEFLRTGSSTGRVIVKGVKPFRTLFLGTDGGRNIFFRYDGRPEVYLWDSSKQFREENFERVYGGTEGRLATCVAPDFASKKMLVLESDYLAFFQTGKRNVEHRISTLLYEPEW
ncbi:uncharacterized protein LOC132196863 [Neocloeon triangulifer]|uniref:uncharacterized protein LOC132196863 n=1 Tax=Neocloeon triangulifer TaxID=2078957 RepID=UPI00286F90EA|nr:uncharacterized protein LOC132196863 [Neocloeon triangulifer]